MTALISKQNITTLFIYTAWPNYGLDVLNITMHTEVVIKSVAHLLKFHRLQWEVVKVKFLMNSNMTLAVLNLHQKTDPKVQQDFKGQGHYNKVKSRSHHDVAHQQPLTNVPTKHQLPTPHGF